MKMDYEVVTLAEKKVVGISTRTNNFAPDMGEKIGQL
jgi:predicted transcriptional regulator YdeE